MPAAAYYALTALALLASGVTQPVPGTPAAGAPGTSAPATPTPARTSPPSLVRTASPSPRRTPTPAPIEATAGPTPLTLHDGAPDWSTTLGYILTHAPAVVHASEVRAGVHPHERYRIDYTSTYSYKPGKHCDLGVVNTFVQAFTDTNDAVADLDPPDVWAIEDESGRNVFSPAFTQAAWTEEHTSDRLNGATRNTYTWRYSFVYRFNAIDLSRLRLERLRDPEQRQMFEPFLFTDDVTAMRVTRAVARAAKLCGDSSADPFAEPSPSSDPFAEPAPTTDPFAQGP